VSALAPEAVAAAYISACRAELQAVKPGNVHVHADGHRMTTRDFKASAEASAGPLAEAGARIGRRILDAVLATHARVATNTNLGIVLLCAPLAAAAQEPGDLWAELADALARLDRQDAADAYEAIRIASPAGLGSVAAHDVRSSPGVDLRAAMQAAAGRDRIARAYATSFEDVAGLGLTSLAAARRAGLAPEWQTSAVYLAFLAEVPDTHVARKHGPGAAEEVRARAEQLRDGLDLSRAPLDALLSFDRDLKGRGLNPGTSADFTVATLFADALISAKARHIRLVG
jgi:triphosphoribosyl-dephospho-CoA synthase